MPGFLFHLDNYTIAYPSLLFSVFCLLLTLLLFVFGGGVRNVAQIWLICSAVFTYEELLRRVFEVCRMLLGRGCSAKLSLPVFRVCVCELEVGSWDGGAPSQGGR